MKMIVRILKYSVLLFFIVIVYLIIWGRMKQYNTDHHPAVVNGIDFIENNEIINKRIGANIKAEFTGYSKYRITDKGAYYFLKAAGDKGTAIYSVSLRFNSNEWNVTSVYEMVKPSAGNNILIYSSNNSLNNGRA